MHNHYKSIKNIKTIHIYLAENKFSDLICMRGSWLRIEMDKEKYLGTGASGAVGLPASHAYMRAHAHTHTHKQGAPVLNQAPEHGLCPSWLVGNMNFTAREPMHTVKVVRRKSMPRAKQGK